MLVKLAWRSIWRNRRRTIITLVSIVLGVALTSFIVAMSEGVYGKLVDDAVRMQAGHVCLQHPDYLDEPSADLTVRGVPGLRRRIAALEQVEATKILILGEVLVKSANGATGAALMGVEPGVEARTSILAEKLVAGRYLEPGDEARIVIGATMAKQLKLEEGKKAVLTANSRDGELVEEMCRVSGIFRTGSDEIDGGIVQAPAGFARRLLGLKADEASQIGVILRDPGDKGEIVRRVRAMTDGASGGAKGIAVLPWEKVVPEVAAYVRLDRASGWVFEGLILFLILFTIFNTILMSVMERQREFAVLLAVGTSRTRLRAQILIEAAILNALGCAAGLLIGGLTAWYYRAGGIDFSSFYGGSEVEVSGFPVSAVIYPAPTFRQAGIIGGLVFTVTMILSLIPVWRSGHVKVAELVRGER